MTAMMTPPAIETVAVQAVRLGRRLAETWPDVAAARAATFVALPTATLQRFETGEVFCGEDGRLLSQELALIGQTLEGYRAGYGSYFLQETTDEHPFQDPEQDRVRRFGELLKAFLFARQTVLDTIQAQRQVQILRGW